MAVDFVARRRIRRKMPFSVRRKKVPQKVRKYVRKTVRKISQVLKQSYINYADATIPVTTGSFYLLNRTILTASPTTWNSSLYRGTRFHQREGDEVLFHKMSVTFGVNITGGNPIATAFRVIVFYQKQPRGVAPDLGDMLQDGTAKPWASEWRYDMRQQFRVLYDRIFPSNSQYAQIGTGGEMVPVRIRKTFKTPLKTSYTAGAEAQNISEISIGAIYVGVLSNNDLLQVVDFRAGLLFTDA